MAHVPSSEELYQLVDARFRSEHPHAPERFRTRPEHAPLRAAWSAIRDDVLKDEVNRIYWDQNPDAPHRIDPDNPDHNRFERAWLEIRDQITENTPHPPDDDAGVDVSYVRAKIMETLHDRLPLIRPDLHEDMQHFADYAIDQIRQAGDAQLIGGGEIWSLPSAIYESREDATHTVDASADARWADNGALAGDIYLVVTNPVGS